jgi:hypothetical protein
LVEGFALSGKGFVSAKITRDTKSQETAKSQETEIIKIFLLLEFTWRNQVMGEHGERYFLCSNKQRGCETQHPNLFIRLIL